MEKLPEMYKFQADAIPIESETLQKVLFTRGD